MSSIIAPMTTHSAPKHKHSAPIVRNLISKRRSNRMALSAPVALSGLDRHKASFKMSSKATNLNRHGAAIQLNRELPVGSTVVVRNARGIELSAKVVAPISAVEGLLTYGIEFVEKDDRTQSFWGISFPTS